MKKNSRNLGFPFRRPRHITRRTISAGSLTNHKRMLAYAAQREKDLEEVRYTFAERVARRLRALQSEMTGQKKSMLRNEGATRLARKNYTFLVGLRNKKAETTQ